MKGKGCSWNARGFGFITPDNGGEDVFCHVTAIKDGNAFANGADLEYRLSYDATKQKYRAESVTGGIYESNDRDRYDRGYDRGGYDRRDRGGYDRYDRRDRDRGYDRRDRDRYDRDRRDRDRDRRDRSRSRDRRY